MPPIPPGTNPIDLSTFAARSQAARAVRGFSLAPASNPSYFQPQPGQAQNQFAPGQGQQPQNPTGQAVVKPGQSLAPNQNINQRAFGPLLPLQPRYLPTDPEGQGPRQFQYPVGANIITSPRREYADLIPFEQLWNLVAMYDVASMCVATRIEETQGMGWSIVPKDKRKQRSYQNLCDEVEDFFRRPDGFTSFETWIGALVREHLVTDAVTVFPHLNKGGGLYALELVDGSCYSDDTEVLTKDGWKLFRDVDIKKDYFATRNQTTKEFQWQKATYYHEAESTGEMYHFKTRTLDLLVTANHRMLIDSLPRKLGGSSHRDRGEAIITAEELHKYKSGASAIPSTSVWVGKEISSFVIQKTTPRSNEFVFEGDDFVAFMGMWLAEGCWSNKDQVMISQMPRSKGYTAFKELLTRIFGKEPCHTGYTWVIGNKALHDYLSQFGKALDKFVPQEIMDASSRQLEIFWHYYMLGDGHFAKDGRERISTSSKRMSDQLQEVAQKIGLSASIIVRIRTEDVVITQTGQVIKAEDTAPNYIVSLHATKKQLVKSSIKKEYTGKVYCVSVPNEVLYVRRNGQPVWCGNTIKPILDDRGRTLSYQQILYGFPFSDYKRPYTEDKPDDEFPTFSTKELLYLPRFTTTRHPYGSPPTEWIVMRVNQAIRKQISDLAYFSEGNIPDMLATLGDGQQYTAEQVEEFEVWFNSILQGNDIERRKLRFIPNAVDVKELRQFTYETTLDEWMLRITCAAFAVPPQELGFTDDVNRASAELQEAVNERRGQKPLSTWLKRALLDEVIHNWLGRNNANASISLPGQPTQAVGRQYKDVEFSWSFGDKTDAATQSTTDRNYVEMGAISPDEIRSMRFGGELEGPAPKKDDGSGGGGGAGGGGGGDEVLGGPENEAGGAEDTSAGGAAEGGPSESAEAATTPPDKESKPKKKAAVRGVEIEPVEGATGEPLSPDHRHNLANLPLVIYPGLARAAQADLRKSAMFPYAADRKPKGKDKPKSQELDAFQRDWLENLIYLALDHVFEDYNHKLSHKIVTNTKREFSPIWNDLSYDLKRSLEYELKRTVRTAAMSLPPGLQLAVDGQALCSEMDVAVAKFVEAEIGDLEKAIRLTIDDPISLHGVIKDIAGHAVSFADAITVVTALDQLNTGLRKVNSLADKLGFGKTLLFPPKHLNCRCKLVPIRIPPEKVQELAQQNGYLNEDADGNFYYMALADELKKYDEAAAEADADYDKQLQRQEDAAMRARVKDELAAQEKRRQQWRESKQRQRARDLAVAAGRQAAQTQTDAQVEADAEAAAAAEKDWQRKDDAQMRQNLATEREQAAADMKAKMAEFRHRKETERARDRAAIQAKTEAASGVWIACWHTDFSDACTKTMRMPWGDDVPGCKGMSGLCVTEGPYLGKMVRPEDMQV